MRLLHLLEEGNVSKRKLIINDRLDIALLGDIQNVHLPSHGLQVKAVKQKFPQLKVGCSIHSYEEAVEAEHQGADYVLYGHIYETKCKEGKRPRGIYELEKMKMNLCIPVYAIGGILPENIWKIHLVKADGVAVMSGIFSTEDPIKIASKYHSLC